MTDINRAKPLAARKGAIKNHNKYASRLPNLLFAQIVVFLSTLGI
jgi:hypothetical protein